MSAFMASMNVTEGDFLLLSKRARVYPCHKYNCPCSPRSKSRLIGVALNSAKRGESVEVASHNLQVKADPAFRVLSVRHGDKENPYQVDFA